MFDYIGGPMVGGAPRMLNTEPLPMYKAFHEVDTAPPRMPERFFNPVDLAYVPPPQIDLPAFFPKPEPVRAFPKPVFFDPDPLYLSPGRIASLARKGLLRFSDDD